MKWPAFPGLIKRGKPFARLFEAVALAIPADPFDLAVIVNFESATTWEPIAQNPSTMATGLLQWIPSTAVNLGMAKTRAEAPDTLRAMTAEAQAAWIPPTFQRSIGSRNTAAWQGSTASGKPDIGNLYLLIFAPAFAGRDEGVIGAPGSEVADKNKGLRDDAGAVTVESVKSMVDELWARADSMERWDDGGGPLPAVPSVKLRPLGSGPATTSGQDKPKPAGGGASAAGALVVFGGLAAVVAMRARVRA